MKKTIISVILVIILIALSILGNHGYEVISKVGFLLVLISIYIIFFPDFKRNLKHAFYIMLIPIIFVIALLLAVFFTTNNSLINFFAACFFISLAAAVIYSLIKR